MSHTTLRADWRASVSALGLGALAVAAALLLTPAAPADLDDLYGLGKPGHDDDPSARIAWEAARLADPATGRVPDGIRERELAYATTLPMRASSFAGGTPWALRGPANLGGRTRALGVDAADPNVLVAGGVSGGMWRSTDAGGAWTKTSGPLQLQSVTTLVQDRRPGRTDTWYYGTGEFRANSAGDPGAPYRGDGVYRSTDNGLSWAPLAATVSGTPQSSDAFDYIWRLAADPTNTAQDELYAATWQGIYRTVDGGDSWTEVLAPAGFSGAADVAVGPDGRVYAALQRGDAYWRSDDGVTWTSITPADLPGNHNRTVVAVAPSDPDVVYFVGDHGDGYAAPNTVFYRYDAGTDTMDNRSANAQSATGGIQNYIQYCLGAAVHPTLPDVVYLAGVDLYRTDDAFATASVTQLGNGHADNHEFVFDGGVPLQLYVGSDGGVHRTLDLLGSSGAWLERTTGYTTSQFYAIALDPEVGGERLLGGTQDNGSWLARSAAPADWVKLQGGDGAFAAFTATANQYIVSYQNGVMIRRTYNAAGTQINAIDVSAPSSGFQFIHPLTIDPVGRRALYTFTRNDIWRNPDITVASPSSGWSQISNAVLGSISAVTAATVPAERLWVGTSVGRLYRIDQALSASPVIVQVDPAEFPNGNVVSVAAHPTNPAEAVVSFSNYGVISLWRTTDDGATWQPIAGNLEENPDGTGVGPSTRQVGILTFAADGPRYFVATSAGVYSTFAIDGMDTVWALEAPDTIGYLVTDGLETRSSDGVVAVATHGGGMFSASFSPPPVATEATGASPALTLGAPYPNPSAGRAVVSVRAGTAGPVRVELFDTRGRRVALLHDAPLAAGAGVTLPLSDAALAAGRYVIRATSRDAVATAAATVVR